MDLAALRRWWPLAAVIVLLGLASLAATHSTPQLERVQPGVELDTTGEDQLGRNADARQPAADGAAAPAEPQTGLPDWAGTAALYALGVLLAVVVALVVWAVVRDQLRRRAARPRRRQVGPDAPRTADDLVAALDAGLQDLSDTDRDARKAVIACWVRLEQAAADAGTPRHPGDTPGDLVGRLLAEQQVDASVLGALAAVYREARYATHTVDERMRAEARAALQRLRADLAAGAGSYR
jgi:hypothetical protein